jgi:hypothetical protein
MSLVLTNAPARWDNVACDLCGDAGLDLAWRTGVDPGSGDRPRQGAAAERSGPEVRLRGKGLVARFCEAVLRSKVAEAERLIARYRRLTR